MVQENASLQLTMVSIPVQPVWTNPPTPPEQKPPGQMLKLARQVGLLVLIGLMSVGCYFGISRFFLQSVEVVGVSMVPTLRDSNFYLLNRWAFQHSEPQRGDVVVIRDPGDHGFSVKRVIALAGESVYFKNGRVYINGAELGEPYLSPSTHTFMESVAHEQFITCGKDQYFVMGDNRSVSIDSRIYGPVQRPDILGPLVLPGGPAQTASTLASAKR